MSQTITVQPHPLRPMRADARRNYDRLVEVAHEVFTEQGVGASLEEIARRAGVGTGTLYRHFPTREALQLAVMEQAFTNQHAYALTLLQRDNAADALDDYIRYWMRHTAIYKGLAVEAMKAAMEGDTEQMASSCLLVRVDAETILTRAQESGQIRADVTQKDVWRLLHGVVMAVKDTEIDQDTAAVMVDVILKGIRTDR
ncbi:MAG: helix-turn-helix domain-containing protein [Thermomicrobiales bacterium]